MKPVEVGDAVEFSDEQGNLHSSLLTYVWGSFGDQRGNWTDEELAPHGQDVARRLRGTPKPPPTVNLVYVSKDPNNRDPFGQLIERRTSVPHETSQGSATYFWRNK